ncbi:MAG: hypothetical protein R2809_06725 [Flavobacteriales bacterium]
MAKLFPDVNIDVVRGKVQESGNSVLPESGKSTPQRWIKVNDNVYVGLDDGLYHARYGDDVIIAFDSSSHVVGYHNLTSLSGSSPSNTGVIGAIALMIILTAVLYYGGIWNYIWKGFDIWWLTIGLIFIYSLYAVLWTPIFAFREFQREQLAHKKINQMMN